MSRKEVIQIISETIQEFFMFKQRITWITFSGEVAAKFDEAWAGDSISGNDYITITYLCITTVPLVNNYLGGVGGSTTEKLTL